MSEIHLDSSKLAMFRELREPGGPDPVIELIEIFISQGHELLARAQTAVAQGDFRAARHAIHSLRGSAGNVGAGRLATLAGGLETELEAFPPRIDQSSLDDLRGEFSHVTTLLEREKQAA